MQVVPTGTTGLAIQLKRSNHLCLWTQPRAAAATWAATWATETLTEEGELHDQDAPCLVPEEALPLVASLRTQEKPGERRVEGGWVGGGRRGEK